MADQCTACSDGTYGNMRSCPPQRGISAFQPACQALIDGNIVNNPCYNAVSGISTWTFKFFIDSSATSPISSILIPVCSDIQKPNIAVEERIDSLGRFNIIPFGLYAVDDVSGNAPAGFQWLAIENSGRFRNSTFVEYRISIEGNYPAAAQPLIVKSGGNRLQFTCQEGGFIVPGCPIPDRMELETDCDVLIQSNSAALVYNANIKNAGASTLKNIQYQDILNYDGVNIGLAPAILPEDMVLEITSTVPNALIISGIIPSIPPGESVSLKFTIPILSFAQPGAFIFTNITTSATDSVTVSDTCTASIEAVKLSADKYIASENSNQILSYTILTSIGTSPATNVGVTEQITIPSGVTVQFTDFSGCTAVYTNGTQVPLNTNITDAEIKITCGNIPVPAGGGVRMSLIFNVTSTSAFQSPAVITATLQQVTGVNNRQIYLTPSNVPSSASISITGGLKI